MALTGNRSFYLLGKDDIKLWAELLEAINSIINEFF